MRAGLNGSPRTRRWIAGALLASLAPGSGCGGRGRGGGGGGGGGPSGDDDDFAGDDDGEADGSWNGSVNGYFSGWDTGVNCDGEASVSVSGGAGSGSFWCDLEDGSGSCSASFTGISVWGGYADAWMGCFGDDVTVSLYWSSDDPDYLDLSAGGYAESGPLGSGVDADIGGQLNRW
jgi:hypothetical protein